MICLEEEAFYTLVESVVQRLQPKNSKPTSKWINTDDAMALLGIKSKTTLQKLRDEGKIKFSQPQKRIILYDRDSIENYLESNSHQPF